MTTLTFPDPFSDAVVEEIKELIRREEVNNLTVALDAKINSQLIPEWYRINILSRIYSVLFELRTTLTTPGSKGKVESLLSHMKKKYGTSAVHD